VKDDVVVAVEHIQHGLLRPFGRFGVVVALEGV
jgi:hypothetical protein